jgi:hypothetical protein
VVKGKGNIKTTISTNVYVGILPDVFYIPGIAVNLFSFGKVTERGVTAVQQRFRSDV